MTTDDLVIASDNVRCIVSPNAGGRLSSIIAFGRELLIIKNDETNLQKWGCYPMAPWAGRVRNGVFTHQSNQHQLEINMHPHAIHGTVLDRPWKLIDSDSSNVVMKMFQAFCIILIHVVVLMCQSKSVKSSGRNSIKNAAFQFQLEIFAIS